jgi:hypothetical protein
MLLIKILGESHLALHRLSDHRGRAASRATSLQSAPRGHTGAQVRLHSDAVPLEFVERTIARLRQAVSVAYVPVAHGEGPMPFSKVTGDLPKIVANQERLWGLGSGQNSAHRSCGGASVGASGPRRVMCLRPVANVIPVPALPSLFTGIFTAAKRGRRPHSISLKLIMLRW